MAVAVVLFEGGLSLKFSEARKVGTPLLTLVLGGLILTLSATAFIAHHVAGLSWATSCVLGAILVVTGPTVIKPMLRHARLSSRPALLLKWEGIVNDGLGAILAVVIVEVAVHEGDGGFPVAAVLALLVVSTLVGLGLGWFLAQALRRQWIPEHLKAPAILAGVLVVFAVSEALFHESGLMAVTLAGVVLANVESASMEDIRRFKEDMATVLVALLFIVLSARLEWSHVSVITGSSLLFVLAVVFLVRPFAIWTSLAFQQVPWRERVLLGWIAPRGVVAAAMGGALAPRLESAGYQDAELIVPILFAVIVSTVLLHGLTIRPLARRLGVAADGEGGALLVGISRWSVELALAARDAGISVELVDSNYRNVARARSRGVRAYLCEVLDEEEVDDLPIEQVSCALLATEDDHYNSIAALALSRVFGRDNVFQIPRGTESLDSGNPSLQGLVSWDPRVSFTALARCAWTPGRIFRTTKLSAQNTWDDFLKRWPGANVLLADDSGRVLFPQHGQPLSVGTRLVFLPQEGQDELLGDPGEDQTADPRS